MQKVYGRPGAYGYQEARKRTFLQLAGLIVVGFGFAVVLGYSMGAKLPWWASLGSLILISGCAYVTSKIVDQWFENLQKERRKYLRGGEGEDLVGWLLEDLPDTYHVFHGIQLKDGADIDHIVVGPGGISVISTKNLRGHFSHVQGKGFLMNGQPKGELLRQALAQAMDVRNRLKVLTEADPFVQAVLAVPWGYVEVRNPVEHVWVVHRDDLLKMYQNAPNRLEPAQVERYVKAVSMLAEMSRDVTRESGGMRHKA